VHDRFRFESPIDANIDSKGDTWIVQMRQVEELTSLRLAEDRMLHTLFGQQSKSRPSRSLEGQLEQFSHRAIAVDSSADDHRGVGCLKTDAQLESSQTDPARRERLVNDLEEGLDSFLLRIGDTSTCSSVRVCPNVRGDVETCIHSLPCPAAPGVFLALPASFRD
jgi:hypothetical protein